MNMDEDAAKKLRDLEQNLAMIAENLPPMWRRVYENCVLQGFTEQQAFQIILVQINASNGGTLKP